MEENIKDILKAFLNQSRTGNLKTSHFPNSYADLKLKTSFGQGNSARIPWISFLGGNQTTSNGIYPVYLFFKEQNKLILAYGISETIVPLLKWNLNVKTIKEYFNDIGVKPDRYGNSYVYKAYNIDEIEWNDIEKDLNNIIKEYKKILKLENADQEKVEGLVVCDNTGWIGDAIIDLENYENIVLWWDKSPTGGLEVINQLKISITSPNKCFYIYYSTSQIATYRARVKDFALENDFSSKNWNSDNKTGWYFSNFNEYTSEKNNGTISYAKILFLVDEIEKLDKPIPLKNFNFYKHYQTPTQNNMQPYSSINIAEELIMNDISNRSLSYFLSIKTKPFIILAGLSGTGKSRLVRALAYQFNNIDTDRSEKQSPSNFKLIKVKPNWHDSSDLLGYESRISGSDRYIVTEFVCFIAEAWKHPNTPFFLCLDEMNLAPVEQYFAEYLSVIETREVKESGEISTDCLISSNIIKKYAEKRQGVDAGFNLWAELNIAEEGLQKQMLTNGLCLPGNLIIIGTVNMDETTHSFSRKVLDRAMTIEMNDINLSEGLNDEGNAWDYAAEPLSAQLVLSENTHGFQVFSDLGETGQTIITYLEEVNSILEKSPFKIAYRVRDEFLLYAYNYNLISDKPATWLTDVLDNMTLMKILPRIEGDDHKTNVLDALIDVFTSRELQASLKKAEEMIEKRNTYHYTSFWS